MGYSKFSAGDRVRINSGEFQGVAAAVAPPPLRAHAAGTVELYSQAPSKPVIIEALIDGRLVTLRVPSALLDHVVE
ncbi:MAG: hypothetical protein JNL18_05990 [Planctomycetaceae bacterium]|nr:hypothetical protein [Planctomycetaceae bacterium]